ncbi:unnamed protein product [Durusdinium trenchii]|uniref:Uncharacterized protein n=1 Tax=Durusdinium trenchii TaxID=1381693 RepID=A0ABP0N122_9DINO
MMKYRGTEIYVAAVEWRLRILATSAACLVMFLPFYLNATACREVPTCVAEVTNAYPQRYHAFVSMGLVVILLREGTLLLVSATDWLLDPKKSQGLEFQDYLSQGLLCAILASLSSVEAYLATSELPLVHLGTVPVYSIRYLEWLVDVPLLMILTCCGALGRPLSEALGPILVTNGYIVVSWCTLFIEDFAVRWAVISHTFLAYAWASERMIQWVKDFWKEAKDVPCRGGRAASVILLIVVFGIYGVIYLLGCSGVISFATEHLGYTFMGFGCKVTLSILFASIRAYQTHQVLARLLGKLRGVSVAFVSLLRGTFDHVVPCTVTSEGQCYLPERSSREFHELERFLNQTVEVASFNDLLRHDEQGRFKDYVKNLLRQNDVSLSDSVELTGVATLQALSANRIPIADAITVWGSHHNQAAKPPPIEWLKQEAGMGCCPQWEIKDPLLHDLMDLMTEHWGHTLNQTKPVAAPPVVDGEPSVASDGSGEPPVAPDGGGEPAVVHDEAAARASLEAERQAILKLDSLGTGEKLAGDEAEMPPEDVIPNPDLLGADGYGDEEVELPRDSAIEPEQQVQCPGGGKGSSPKKGGPTEIFNPMDFKDMRKAPKGDVEEGSRSKKRQPKAAKNQKDKDSEPRKRASKATDVLKDLFWKYCKVTNKDKIKAASDGSLGDAVHSLADGYFTTLQPSS